MSTWRSSGDLYRWPIAVDNTGGGAGSIDWSGSLPAAWSHFWDVVQSTGNDIRVVGPDGTTVATFDLETFSTANKTGTIEVDNWTAPAAGMLVFWLYWGDAALSSGETVFAPASAKNAYFDLGAPAQPFVRVVQEERQGDTSPRKFIAKTSDESIYVWFDFTDVLQERVHLHNGTLGYEGISYVSGYTVVKSGVDQSAMKDVTKTRFTSRGGRFYVKVWVTAGSTGDDCIVTVTCVTTEGRTITGKCKLQVRNMS